MKKRSGQQILDEAVFAGVPLGADPVQMRADQDAAVPPAEPVPEPEPIAEMTGTCPKCAYKGKSNKKGMCPKCGAKMEAAEEKDDELDNLDNLWVPPQSLISFQTFYQEGKHEEAAKLMAGVLGVGEEVVEVDEEKVKAQWARIVSEASAKFSFLRKAMIKFNSFIGTAKSSWDKLPEAQKKTATKFLKSKASKMGAELKSLLGGLDEKSPADKVLMAAMLAYMFGVGMSGEGALAAESSDE